MISTSELFDIGSGIKRICEENTVYLNALIEKDKEIERLRKALKRIAEYDTYENWQSTIARAALKGDE